MNFVFCKENPPFFYESRCICHDYVRMAVSFQNPFVATFSNELLAAVYYTHVSTQFFPEPTPPVMFELAPATVSHTSDRSDMCHSGGSVWSALLHSS